MPAKYTVLDFAADVLSIAPSPLTFQQIWDLGKGLPFSAKLGLQGKTPWQTVGSRLFVDTRDNEQTRFVKVGKNPARFWLVSRKTELKASDYEPTAPAKDVNGVKTSFKFHERELHPLLAYFAYASTSFSPYRPIYTKTIRHEISTAKGYSEWAHPDMVGFYVPLEDWEDELLALNKAMGTNAIRLYSFELKKRIDKVNYREYFFQAVSNSSWAHEGYLVAAEIAQDEELLAELQRLSAAFGIGLVELDLANPDESSIVLPARKKTVLDWEMMSKLCQGNADFKTFIDDVQRDYTGSKIHRSEYDAILEDPEDYAAKLLGKK